MELLRQALHLKATNKLPYSNYNIFYIIFQLFECRNFLVILVHFTTKKVIFGVKNGFFVNLKNKKAAVVYTAA